MKWASFCAEITCQSLLESGLQDCVVAFQRLCDVLFNSIPDSPKPPSNAFQRLEQGSQLWKQVLTEGYEEWMDTNELNSLNTLFQKRHLLAHCEGIVDEKYLRHTADSDYQLGQRIVISEDDVLKMAGLVTELATQLRLRVDKL